MELLFQTAIQNVKSFEDQNNKRINDAIEHYMSILTKGATTKIEKASSSGKTQILLYRINFRKSNNKAMYNSHKKYYYNNIKITDLYEFHGLQEKLQAFFDPFKVTMVNTSPYNWCIFVYWRDQFSEDTSDSSECTDSESEIDSDDISGLSDDSESNGTCFIDVNTANCLKYQISGHD